MKRTKRYTICVATGLLATTLAVVASYTNARITADRIMAFEVQGVAFSHAGTSVDCGWRCVNTATSEIRWRFTWRLAYTGEARHGDTISVSFLGGRILTHEVDTIRQWQQSQETEGVEPSIAH